MRFRPETLAELTREDAVIKPFSENRAGTLCSETERKRIQQRVLRWFAKKQRPLPWRQTRDPYAIWVSEVMLQQTQAATVVPYYKRFLKAFPTVKALAKADLSRVLKVWEGLGFYVRARSLHRAARVVVDRFAGHLPDNLEALQRLPGIGRYTAGAILSIAYNQKAPVLDGNVKRVLSRLFALSQDPNRGKTQDLLWNLAEGLVPRSHAGAFNQGLMELGATICTPKKPLCTKCPLKALCKAAASGFPENYPVRRSRKRIPHITAVGVVIRKNGRVLLRQRPAKGLLGGLWEFPNWTSREEVDHRRELQNLLRTERTTKAQVGQYLGSFDQAFSHFKLTLHVYLCHSYAGSIDGKWIPVKSLASLPMPRLHRRIANSLVGK